MSTQTKAKPTSVLPLYASPVQTADGRILPTHGPRVIRWIEKHLVFGEGDWFGKPVVLLPFQKRFVKRLYEYWPETGHRRYRRALWGAAKGNTKTATGAVIGGYELGGGTRIAPRVIIGAAALKQANLVYADLRHGISESPSLSSLFDCFELQVLMRGGQGVAERIAAEAGTNDGARCTCFIGDEAHEWTGRTKRVWLIVDGAVAKRKDAFSLALTTAGVIGEESVAEDLYDYGKKVCSGELVDDSFLMEWYEAPDKLVLTEPDQWLEAVRLANPALGDIVDVDSLRHRYETIPQFEFRRYHLNQWVEAGEPWISPEMWDANKEAPEIADGDDVVLAVDAGLKHDSTAVTTAAMKDGVLHVVVKTWTPKGDGEQLDLGEVEAHIRHEARRLNVLEVAYDPYFFQRSSQTLAEEGLPMVEFPQTDARMAPASQTLFALLSEGKVRHGGDATLRRHAMSAVVKETERGWRVSKSKSKKQIDALVTLVIAADRLSENEGGDLVVSVF